MASRENHTVTPADVIKSVKIVGDDLPHLTEKQQGFVQEVMNGCSASEAYRRAYGVGKSSATTISANACKLYHNPKIERWLSAARQAHMGAAILNRENHMREMERLRELAVDSGDLKSAVKAEEVRGYVAGLRIERAEITINNPAAILAEINKLDPTVAGLLAEKYAIPVAPVIEHEPSATGD